MEVQIDNKNNSTIEYISNFTNMLNNYKNRNSDSEKNEFTESYNQLWKNNYKDLYGDKKFDETIKDEQNFIHSAAMNFVSSYAPKSIQNILEKAVNNHNYKHLEDKIQKE